MFAFVRKWVAALLVLLLFSTTGVAFAGEEAYEEEGDMESAYLDGKVSQTDYDA